MDHQQRDEWIRDRAYALWEMSGRENGRDQEHWQRAQQDWQDQQARHHAGARPPTEEEKAAILARLGGSNESILG